MFLVISLRLEFGVTRCALAAWWRPLVGRDRVVGPRRVNTEIRSIVTFWPAMQVAVMQQPPQLAVACSIRFWRFALRSICFERRR